MIYTLRDYQTAAVEAISDFVYHAKGRKNKAIVVAPCGAGKSLIIGNAVHNLTMKTLVIQPSVELLKQNFDKYISYGNKAEIYSAALKSKTVGEVTFATPLSLKGKHELFKDVELVFVDEAHTFCKTGSVLDEFISQLSPSVKVVGLTATPVLLRQGMYGAELKMLNRTRDSIFQRIIHVTQITEVIDNGFWTPLTYKVATQDKSMLSSNSSGSDFTDGSLEKYYFDNDLTSEIIKIQRENSHLKSFIIFVPSVRAAEDIASKIEGMVPLSAKTNKSVRESIVKAFLDNRIRGIVNVNVLSTGFDKPDLSCVIDCTPTMSISKYYQKLGRVVRRSEGKEMGYIYDLGNNYERFGKIEDLKFEDIDSLGWIMSSNGFVLSGRPIEAPKVSIETLLKKSPTKSIGDTMWFGKYKGHPYDKIPKNYISWILNSSGWTFDTPKMKELQNKFQQILKG